MYVTQCSCPSLLTILVCYGHNESLNSKYLEVLEVCTSLALNKPVFDIYQSHHEHLETLLDPKRLHVLFQAIGANMAQLDRESKLTPTSLPQSEHSLLLPPTLKSIARLLAGAAPW